MQVGTEQWQVVVASVPEDDVRLLLGLAQDGLVVHAGEDDPAGIEVRLVLLALLDGGVVPREVVAAGEALHALGDEVAVGHGVTDDHRPVALLSEVCRHCAGGLALAGSGAHGADGHDRQAGPHHDVVRSQQPELGTRSQGPRRRVHDGLVADVAVGEDHHPGRLLRDDPLQLRLGHDGDAAGVVLAGELRWIAPRIDARDLRRREGHDLDRGIGAEHDVEVVEVAPRSTHDDDLRAFHGGPPMRPGQRSAQYLRGAAPSSHRRRR